MGKILPNELIIDWDVKNWSRVLDFWHNHTALQIENCRSLEVGANKGGLSLYLAQKGATVVCSDITEPAPEVQSHHRQMGFAQNLSYTTVDVCAIPFEDNSFDIILFKSVMGALRTYSRQKQMISEIHRVLKPGGELWFAENLVASPLHRLARRYFVKWGKSWRYVTSLEIQQLCQSFSQLYLENYGLLGAFGRTEKQRRILGSMDALINGCIPCSWKYIAFGLARK